MMNRPVFGCRSSCAGQAWPVQATGALQPRGSLPTFSRGQILSANAVIAHRSPNEPSRLTRTLTASDRLTSSPEIHPLINTHRSPSGRRFCPIDF